MYISSYSYGNSEKLKIMDLISLREVQEYCLKIDIPFVSFRMPDSTTPVTFISDTQPDIVNDQLLFTKTRKGFIFSPFSKKLPSVWLNADTILKGYHFESIEIEAGPGVRDISITPASYAVSKDEYLDQIESILAAISAEEITKVVLSRVLDIEFDKKKETALLFDTLSTNLSQAFVYLINTPGIGCWIGATPELLLSAENKSTCTKEMGSAFAIQTMALAGTRPFGTEEKWNHKEIEEQEWVSKYIEDALKTSGCEEIQKSGTYTCPAANVEHLRTDFKANIDISKLDQLLNRLHPTPAVCGLPKNKALELISQIELHDRAYYSGFLGPVDPKHNLSLFVNLRCMEIHPISASLYVGGGLTADSNPEAEWNETIIKSRTLLSEIEKMRNLAL